MYLSVGGPSLINYVSISVAIGCWEQTKLLQNNLSKTAVFKN